MNTTKAFSVDNCAYVTDITDAVNVALHARYTFIYTGTTCFISEDRHTMRAVCATPEYLAHANFCALSATFSITLPSHYWRTR